MSIRSTPWSTAARIVAAASAPEQLDAPDAETQLRLIARNARRLDDRAGRLLETVRNAATVDASIADLWQAINDDRVKRAQTTAKRLATKRGHARGFHRPPAPIGRSPSRRCLACSTDNIGRIASEQRPVHQNDDVTIYPS